jgi:ATP-dependent helicase HepA
LVAGFVRQRAAAGGLTGLLSAPIALERHQVEVVRRVLHDPVQPYLLADEVGLGKTIEAGVIVRQHILDHPRDHRVLVIVPEQLQGQWESELRERLQVGAAYGHRVTIVALEELNQQPLASLAATLLVIDEAHQAVAGWEEPEGTAAGARFSLISGRWEAREAQQP